MFYPNRFFQYLHADPERSFDYKTGREEALKSWIVQQPDNSIDPVSLYKKSLRLNGGNIWNALLAIHQLLRNHARHTDKRAYFTDAIESDATQMFNKFVDIRGDLAERGPSFRGDHRGSWYRIWGIMLYRLAEEPYSDNVVGTDTHKLGEALYRNMQAAAVAAAAEWVKPLIGGRRLDWRKVEINRAGAASAAALLYALNNPRPYTPADAWEKCARRDYLLRP